MNADGTIRSIRDKSANRELVNANGELPFNDLLRVEGPDASKVAYPVAPKISVKKGVQMTEITVDRERSSFPLTRITIYNDLDRVELRNELDPTKMPFAGGNNNWNDSYYFAFPFNVSKDGLEGDTRRAALVRHVCRTIILPGARKDSVSTQHLFGLTDGQVDRAARTSAGVSLGLFRVMFRQKLGRKDAPTEFPGDVHREISAAGSDDLFACRAARKSGRHARSQHHQYAVRSSRAERKLCFRLCVRGRRHIRSGASVADGRGFQCSAAGAICRRRAGRTQSTDFSRSISRTCRSSP